MCSFSVLNLTRSLSNTSIMNDSYANGGSYTNGVETSGINRRVLAIQSHVVHGYVGNKSATFPLQVCSLDAFFCAVTPNSIKFSRIFQVLGFDVDAINSVHFSNHTGYTYVKGQVLSDKELHEVFEGLEQNQLLDSYSHLLTGYIGKDSFLSEVGAIVKAMRQVNPELVYGQLREFKWIDGDFNSSLFVVCDPVLGDNGFLYVPKALIPIYQNEIIPLSDICTPNQFEAELLTGVTIESEADAWTALNWFHEKGVKTVVLSSTNIGTENTLTSFLSHKNGKFILLVLVHTVSTSFLFRRHR